MKSRYLLLLGAALCSLFTAVNPVSAQGTAFTYNGRLSDAGSPANGNYDLTFALFDADSGPTQVGSTLTNSTTAVSNGLFNATLDFGAGVFTGANRWLELSVRTNGGGAFTTLIPRNAITPTPYAIYSANAGSAATANTAATAASANSVSGTNITGTISDALLSANVAFLNGNANFSGAVTASSFTGNGALAYQTVAATAQSAAANAGYVLTNDAQTTVTLPPTANAGDLVRVLGTGAGGWQVQTDDSQTLLGGNTYRPAGVTWTARESNRSWYSPASSADGVKVVAVAANGQIYTSTDSGMTWTARESNRFWVAVATSADGTKLVAVVYNGQIYTSTDSGVTWTPRESNRGWTDVASSADGTKLVATVDAGQIYTSTDSGMTWTARESSRIWTDVASSSDGTKLLASAGDGQLYTSTDSGVTWTARESNRGWQSVDSSADGTKLVAVDYYSQIYTSTDSGVTWTARENNRLWYAVASSADGTRLVAGVYAGQLYTSTDSGVTWTARESNRLWNGAVSSADGTKLIAVVDGGQIYTSVGASIFSGASGTASGFQYLGNNVWLAVVEASAASANSVAATNLTGTLQLAQLPGTVLTNNQNGVNLTGTFTGNGASLTNLNAVAKTGDTMTGTLNLPANGLVAGTTQFVLSGGNVGIGTTSPDYPLSVSGSGNFTTSVLSPLYAPLSGGGNSVTVQANSNAGGSGGGVTIQGGSGAASQSGVGGTITLTAGNLTGEGSYVSSSQITIAGNNISLGGNAGDITVRGGAGAYNRAGANISLISGSGDASYAGGAGGSINLEAGNGAGSNPSGNAIISAGAGGAASGYIVFKIGASEMARVSSSGNVGIGTTSPATALHVNGTVTATSFSGSGTGLINISADAIAGGLTTNIAVLVAGGGTNTLCFTNGVLRAVQ